MASLQWDIRFQHGIMRELISVRLDQYQWAGMREWMYFLSLQVGNATCQWRLPALSTHSPLSFPSMTIKRSKVNSEAPKNQTVYANSQQNLPTFDRWKWYRSKILSIAFSSCPVCIVTRYQWILDHLAQRLYENILLTRPYWYGWIMVRLRSNLLTSYKWEHHAIEPTEWDTNKIFRGFPPNWVFAPSVS